MSGVRADKKPLRPQIVHLWREDLRKINPKAAEALADPAQYSNLFPNLDLALQAEKLQVCLVAPCSGETVPTLAVISRDEQQSRVRRGPATMHVGLQAEKFADRRVVLSVAGF